MLARAAFLRKDTAQRLVTSDQESGPLIVAAFLGVATLVLTPLLALQFASTAKYMKNTPYVNEVSSDEALLKRYRKEIMDLKKQLEEVMWE